MIHVKRPRQPPKKGFHRTNCNKYFILHANLICKCLLPISIKFPVGIRRAACAEQIHIYIYKYYTHEFQTSPNSTALNYVFDEQLVVGPKRPSAHTPFEGMSVLSCPEIRTRS